MAESPLAAHRGCVIWGEDCFTVGEKEGSAVRGAVLGMGAVRGTPGGLLPPQVSKRKAVEETGSP